MSQKRIKAEEPPSQTIKVQESASLDEGDTQINVESLLIPHRLMMRLLSTQLLELRLCDCRLLAPECRALACSPSIVNLRMLDLSCNPVRLPGFLALIESETSHLKNLESLDLYMCSISHSQLKLLPPTCLRQKCIVFDRLAYLNLSFNKLGPLLTELILNPIFGLAREGLKELYLSECQIGDV